MTFIPKDRILILDGAMGTMIQRYGLTESDYSCGPFEGSPKELKGNNECLNLTRPDIIKSIHKEYIAAGADIIETNTFSANTISQAEYGCGGLASRMAFEGARIAREAADEAAETAASIGLSRKVLVAGSIGPTSKSLSLSPDVNDPSFRAYSFEEMKEAYRQQAEALMKGGADLILIETCFDALNVKAALAAIQETGKIPVAISVSVGDRSGRTLTGQTLEAFYTSVSHYPIISFGLNCSLGAADLTPLMEEVNRWCSCAVSCYPNAGLPNEMGGYDQTPEEMAVQVRAMAEKRLINIVGGCCGTTPDHIKAIADAVRGMEPRDTSCTRNEKLKVSGLEAILIDVADNNFTNVGERTNVAGSRKFARLIASGEYEEALQIAARQIEDGASVIDVNMDDAMLDSTKEMERFVRYISNDPAVAKAALMIDSSHWETILAGLRNAQGKCIVNSISLKEGEEAFVAKAREIGSYGAAVVVMAFDEEGQATTYERKIDICNRAYRLLTEKAGTKPEDIIFDVNILSIGTGIEEHADYAVDFIEAVRWIKQNLPGALTSGGVSNLSFAFRGNNTVREAMHSAFLYHAIQAGLDMAIVNPSMLQIYDEIEPELLRCVEDVIFNKDPQATERLIEKASILASMKEAGNPSQDTNVGTQQQSLEERLRNALVKGQSSGLEDDLKEAVNKYGSALNVIEGPLMAGMETVGNMFGEGKMFLPQVVKSAKVMRDAVQILEPYMNNDEDGVSRPKVVIATVKGDVHDIGKNITSIVLSCNGFDVIDLGVMVDKDTILDKAEEVSADIVAVSGLITPSLYQMEEICREMSSRQMTVPLFIGGATTSAVHTAVKLAPLYGHVFHGADASAAAVMAKKCMMDRKTFEEEQIAEQQKLRDLYYSRDDDKEESEPDAALSGSVIAHETRIPSPADIPARELTAEEVMPYFDWKMFYAIWGVRYGSASPEAMELMQLRQDAEDELAVGNYRIMISARFMEAKTDGKDIITDRKVIPMMRQECGDRHSLCDFISAAGSPFGAFTICVRARNSAHEEGCCCPACSNKYEDMIAKTVRLTLAEAASKWLDKELLGQIQVSDGNIKVIKPAAGYASCPDHTLKRDIMDMLSGEYDLGIKLTESCAMIPDASICGFILMHPEAGFPVIRMISQQQYEDYAERRNMDKDTARRFLGHLLK